MTIKALSICTLSCPSLIYFRDDVVVIGIQINTTPYNHTADLTDEPDFFYLVLTCSNFVYWFYWSLFFLYNSAYPSAFFFSCLCVCVCFALLLFLCLSVSFCLSVYLSASPPLFSPFLSVCLLLSTEKHWVTLSLHLAYNTPISLPLSSLPFSL